MVLGEGGHSRGLKVILSGEGADEALAGYLWFKGQKLLSYGKMGSYNLSEAVFRQMLHMKYPRAEMGEFKRIQDSLGGLHGQMIVYFLSVFARWWFLKPGVIVAPPLTHILSRQITSLG